MSEPTVVVWTPGNGPWETLYEAAAAAGRADLVILMPGVEVFGGWLERLVAAAGSDTAIASASGMLSGGRWAPSPLPSGGLEPAAEMVAERSILLRPRISEPVAGCVLLRRSALDLAGCGGGPASPAGALAAFGVECTAMGLAHVLADDVLARGVPAVVEPEEAAALDARYPHRPPARELDDGPDAPVERAVLAAGRGLARVSVTIDGRSLGLTRAGTQVHALELIAALGRTGRVSLRVITPPDLDPEAAQVFAEIDDLTLLAYATAASAGVPKTDIVHRPSQVFTASDLALLLPIGRRIVVTHQDLIAYRIPGYHDSVESWLRFRRVTRDTLAGADRVVFFSEHALGDALGEDLVDPATASVVPIGVDHYVLAGRGRIGQRPAALPADDLPFLLCLGADLRHKNQEFAVRLAAALRVGHGWTGRMVFAGPTGTTGRAPLGPAAEGEGQRATVIVLGPVSEAEKAWLLERTVAVVYPTLYEGFGLIPFEAGMAATPCFFAGQTSLSEVLPASAATLVAWDAVASATAVAPLLEDGPARTAHIELLQAAGRRYTWDETATALVELYEEVLAAAPGELRQAPRQRLFLEERLEETERLRQEEWRRDLAFRKAIGSDALGLVGPGGVLDRHDQRALLALLSKRAIRRPAMALARAAYRLRMSVGSRS